MAPSPLRRYRVSISDWNVFSTVIEASSEAEAIKIAEQLFADEGPEAFRWDANGQDDAIADLLEEVRA